jgi:predicted dehydrogenase
MTLERVPAGNRDGRAEHNVVEGRPLSQPSAVLVGSLGHQGTRYRSLLARSVRWAGFVDARYPAARGQLGAPCYTSIGSAIEDVEFDVAIVAVPHAEHQPICVRLLEAGKHVIKEKPFATSTRDAQELCRTAQRFEKSIYTVSQMRWLEGFVALKSQLNSLGDILSVTAEYRIGPDKRTLGWRRQNRMRSGASCSTSGTTSLTS